MLSTCFWSCLLHVPALSVPRLLSSFLERAQCPKDGSKLEQIQWSNKKMIKMLEGLI